MANPVTLLRVKAAESNGERWIEGWATKPEVDRAGDVVVPEGAVFELPIPLLFAHKHDVPIGTVVQAWVTSAGIRIRARLSAGVQAAEEVWQLIKDGALSACSIGFKALKSTPLRNGGLRFDSWEWHELSIVSVPALPGAKVSVAKCMVVDESGNPAVRARSDDRRNKPLFGYRKGMSAAGLDLESMCDLHLEKAKALMREYYEKDSQDTSAYALLFAGFAFHNANASLANLKDLEERVRLIEEKGVVYRGLYNASDEYRRGDLVTFGGSIFHATRETAGISPVHGEGQKPADHPWQLAVKRGRDAPGR